MCSRVQSFSGFNIHQSPSSLEVPKFPISAPQHGEMSGDSSQPLSYSFLLGFLASLPCIAQESSKALRGKGEHVRLTSLWLSFLQDLVLSVVAFFIALDSNFCLPSPVRLRRALSLCFLLDLMFLSQKKPQEEKPGIICQVSLQCISFLSRILVL